MLVTEDPNQFWRACAEPHVLSLDMGYAHIGLAWSATHQVAVILPCISGRQGVWMKALTAVCAAKNPSGMVMGWPVDDQGHVTPTCEKFRDRILSWQRHTWHPLPVLLWNERHTSWAVNQDLHTPHGPTRKKTAVSQLMSHSLCAQMMLTEVLKNREAYFSCCVEG